MTAPRRAAGDEVRAGGAGEPRASRDGAPPGRAGGGARHGPRTHPGAQRTIMVTIGCAGALGALARYAMSRLVRVPSGHFPWSTFWTNATGSLAIGLVLVLLAERFPRARLARPLVVTGFLGAYTTFSTYAVEADLLFRGHDVTTGVVYAFASLFAGILAAAAGVVGARALIAVEHRLSEQLG